MSMIITIKMLWTWNTTIKYVYDKQIYDHSCVHIVFFLVVHYSMLVSHYSQSSFYPPPPFFLLNPSNFYFSCQTNMVIGYQWANYHMVWLPHCSQVTTHRSLFTAYKIALPCTRLWLLTYIINWKFVYYCYCCIMNFAWNCAWKLM